MQGSWGRADRASPRDGGSGEGEDDDGDERLWELICGGDRRAFGDLFRRHADFIYNYVFRRTASWDAAEEIVSAAFLEAWRQRTTVVTLDGSLRPWLVGVAQNQVRRWWRGRERSRRAIGRLSVVADSEEHDHAVAVADRVDDERQMASVLAYLDRLSEAHREVLLLWAWEGFSYKEIATALGISVGTVRSRLSRARARLTELDPVALSPPATTSTGPTTAGTPVDRRACISDVPPTGPRDRPTAADRGEVL